MTPKSYFDKTIGKAIDTDNYPRENPYQCWDYFDYFCRLVGFEGSRYCAVTKFVGDLWVLRDSKGYEYSRDFEYITDPAQFKDGDWIFWAKHVAMYYHGKEVGQNQPKPHVTEKEMNWNGILGAMRYKHWKNIEVAFGASDVVINGHKYYLYKQTPQDDMYVLGAGLNQVKPIREIDADVLVNGKLGNGNYYQMKKDIPDQPYGTTYGDISAPLSGEYQNLPNQDSTLFYDLDTGEFGDCTYVTIDPTHNVFSPALVFPNKLGHWEYARMVGLSHKDSKSMYGFVIRYHDGYCLGIADKELTPQQIADDFTETDMMNIAFLDGGGSAMFGRWENE